MNRFEQAVASIDAANAEDPGRVTIAGVSRPAELVYGERMSATLEQLAPEASELLSLAARAQHIRRWTLPRSVYPMDRAGYHRWRNEAKRRHAEWAGDILRQCGYTPEEIARAGALIRKENLKGDGEAQTLEDVACLVFLEHYAGDFAARHSEDKVVAILRRTLAKMSDQGRAAVGRIPISKDLARLLSHAAAGSEEDRS